MAEDAIAFPAAKRRRRRRSRGGARGGRDMMSALPEHVLQEVLLRVGTVKDLFMLAATCRRWFGRFTDRTFLRELLCPAAAQGQEGLHVLGFFLQDASAGISFLPAPGRRSSGLMLKRALSRTLVPLAARRGFLLVQGVPCRRDTQPTHISLAVCNHVTGQCHHIARLDTDPTDMCCYAIITAADANNAAGAGAGRYTFSQLLFATVEVSTSDWAVHVHSYSAATLSWSAPATLNLVDGRRFSLVGQRSAVVHHGAAHWLWRHDDGSLYKLSVPLGGGGAAGAGCVCLAFTRIPAVSIVDLHNKTMEKVMDCFLPLRLADETNRTAVAVPYEMDLVDFFMFQLGGLRSAGSSG